MLVDVVYLGELRTECTHGPSRSSLYTDAPRDNEGKGAAFSPTDLVATALASCILTIMGIKARDKKIELKGATARVEKHMADNPRRISKLHVIIDTRATELGEAQIKYLKHFAKHCPVHQSLHPDVKQVVEFIC